VPITGNHDALRVVTYQADPNDAALLFLSDPNLASQGTFTLSNVAGKQLVSPYSPTSGSWVLGVYNLSGKPLSATIASNYPFDLDVYHPTTLYLPLVVRQWPPVPETPVLNRIVNPDYSRDYDVTWSSAARADSYTLEEATDVFTDAVARYTGPNITWSAVNHDTGSFYYRVKASNVWGDSLWSNVWGVVVLCPNLLINGDFAAGLPGDPWEQYSNHGHNLISQDFLDDRWGAYMGRFNDAEESIQ